MGPGLEPGSSGSEPEIIGHYTIPLPIGRSARIRTPSARVGAAHVAVTPRTCTWYSRPDSNRRRLVENQPCCRYTTGVLVSLQGIEPLGRHPSLLEPPGLRPGEGRETRIRQRACPP